MPDDIYDFFGTAPTDYSSQMPDFSSGVPDFGISDQTEEPLVQPPGGHKMTIYHFTPEIGNPSGGTIDGVEEVYFPKI